MKKWFVLFMFLSSLVQANCTVYKNKDPLEKKMYDSLYILLSRQSSCPGSIQELKHIFLLNGVQEQISMVANRGRNNPVEGSFSFFESLYGQLPTGELIARGDFFLGYFTRLEGNQIILDQQPEDSKLLIEAFAWDNAKALYNFYELRGIENGATRWFYRGDSTDAYKDNTWLYRDNPKDKEHFGHRMRCSACHNSGGPILKELTLPHNDWWITRRPLILAPNHPDAVVQAILEQVIDADLFADEVQIGAQKLAESNKMIQFHQDLSLQEQLRPLFCTTEINLESNQDESERKVSIPSAFWLNPLLGQIDLAVSSKDYNKVLEEFDMQFPETTLRDADHAWHTPVKGSADINAIKALIEDHIISKQFAESVLMIDYTHPLFSSQRCELLKLLPDRNEEGWLAQFLMNLRENSTRIEGASLLAEYLGYNDAQHQKLMGKIQEYKKYVAKFITTTSGLQTSFYNLIEMRASVYSSEMSQNPKGQILEPGFRVVFPEPRGNPSRAR